jgi:serine/threonine protein kinase
MLKLFSNRRRHDHLIRLLATYEFKGEFYLLFPYAKYNLRDYWEQTPDPDFTQFTVKWVLRQCKGIASAIQRIHGYQTTFEAKEAAKSSQSTRDGAELESAGPNGRLYSRHGDIKPENILWSDEDTLEEDPHFNDQGILLIADFGLMRSHKISTEFRVSPEQVKGSIPYEPPEVAEPRVCTTVSRAYDIWSLGCVYLEFVTWIVCSFDELQRFREVRLSGGHNEAFFTILDTGILSGTRKAIVKESVQEWIKGLHNRPRCSDFIHEFLNLIEHHMLIVDPKQRIHCGSLNEKLTDMVRRADEDSNYLLPQDPLLVQRRAIATAVSEHDAQPPSFIKNGTPLPKRPSVANKAYTTEGSRTLNSTQWQLLSEPSSPTSCRYFHGLVGYL